MHIVCMNSSFWFLIKHLKLWPNWYCIKLLPGNLIPPATQFESKPIIPRLRASRTSLKIQKGACICDADTLTRQYTGKPGLSGAERGGGVKRKVSSEGLGISPGALAYYLRIHYLIWAYCGRESLGSNYAEFRCH